MAFFSSFLLLFAAVLSTTHAVVLSPQELHDAFEGMIAPNLDIAGSFRQGDSRDCRFPTEAVFTPRTAQAAATALNLIDRVGARGTVRSGGIASSNDRLADCLAHRAVHISTRFLRGLSVDSGSKTVRVGAGATAADLAGGTSAHQPNWLLPIDDPDRSVVSAVLSHSAGLAPRALGRLSSRLRGVDLALTNGTIMHVSASPSAPRAERELFERLMLPDEAPVGVVTDVELEADDAAPDAWAERLCTLFTDKAYDDVSNQVWEAAKSWPDNVDLSVRVADGAWPLPYVSICVLLVGHDNPAAADQLVCDLVPSLCANAAGADDDQAPQPWQRGEPARGPEAVAALLADRGVPGSLGCNQHMHGCTKFSFEFALDTLDHDKATQFGELVKDAQTTDAVAITAEVQLLEDRTARLSVLLFTREESEDAQDFVAAHQGILTHLLHRDHAKPPVVVREHDVDDVDDEAVASAFAPTRAAFARAPVTRPQLPGPSDPDLKVWQPGMELYNRVARPYAHGSYPDHHFEPYLVLQPKTDAGVSQAVLLAKALDKKVVAQSGGHQYSGKSTGGQDTVVITMRHFAGAVYNDATGTVTVKVATPLKDISLVLKNKGVAVPHGECPFVNVGGHAHTGGFGHIMRSYGLFLDYIHAIRAVLADGRIVQLCRPGFASCTPTLSAADNAELFRGVLGGGPGSFAVAMEYELEVIRDDDAQPSWGTAQYFLYNRGVFEQILKDMQEWTRKATDPDFSNVDLFITVLKADIPVLGSIGIIILEMAATRDDDGSRTKLLKQISDNAWDKLPWYLKAQSWILTKSKGYNEEKLLSRHAHRGVRDLPQVEEDNYVSKEFHYPYKKRVNGFRHPMTDAFIKGAGSTRGFLDIVDDTFAKHNALLVIQMMVAGGAYATKDTPETGLPWRDVTWGFVYDVFYKKNDVQTAEGLQKKVTALLQTSQPEDADNIRFFWGSYEDTNMNNVWKLYYGTDSATRYPKLQQLKHRMDPSNVFATSFTVQPPKNTQPPLHDEI